jgi:hypothetical protein
VSFGKKFLICTILPPMSELTPFYGTYSKSSLQDFLPPTAEAMVRFPAGDMSVSGPLV